jgi:hypothetical protein
MLAYRLLRYRLPVPLHRSRISQFQKYSMFPHGTVGFKKNTKPIFNKNKALFSLLQHSHEYFLILDSQFKGCAALIYCNLE